MKTRIYSAPAIKGLSASDLTPRRAGCEHALLIAVIERFWRAAPRCTAKVEILLICFQAAPRMMWINLTYLSVTTFLPRRVAPRHVAQSVHVPLQS